MARLLDRRGLCADRSVLWNEHTINIDGLRKRFIKIIAAQLVEESKKERQK
jgi:hypothetical protein